MYQRQTKHKEKDEVDGAIQRRYVRIHLHQLEDQLSSLEYRHLVESWNPRRVKYEQNNREKHENVIHHLSFCSMVDLHLDRIPYREGYSRIKDNTQNRHISVNNLHDVR